MTGIRILSTGKAVPKKEVTNDDMARIVDTSDEWIKQRTGMSVRHHVSDDENHTGLAVEAARGAIEKAGIDKNEIGAVIVCTVSADYYSPSAACLVQGKLGLSKDIIAFDLGAGCSGFVFGIETNKFLD